MVNADKTKNWDQGFADKSAHPGSIPGVASKDLPENRALTNSLARMARQRRRACWDNCWDNRSVFLLTTEATQPSLRSVRRRSPSPAGLLRLQLHLEFTAKRV